jgi:hypothetical protein
MNYSAYIINLISFNFHYESSLTEMYCATAFAYRTMKSKEPIRYRISNIYLQIWQRGTGFPRTLPSAVNRTVDHPLGSPVYKDVEQCERAERAVYRPIPPVSAPLYCFPSL